MQTKFIFKNHCENYDTKEVCDFLKSKKSTTNYFRRICGKDFNVVLINKVWRHACEDEQKSLKLSEEETVFVREVLLQCKEKPLMYARSVFPKNTIQETGNTFIDLENRSLGEILYQDPHLKRNSIGLHRLYPVHCEYQSIKKYLKESEKFVWARESVFYFYKKPLWLYEIFLPDLIPLIREEAIHDKISEKK